MHKSSNHLSLRACLRGMEWENLQIFYMGKESKHGIMQQNLKKKSHLIWHSLPNFVTKSLGNFDFIGMRKLMTRQFCLPYSAQVFKQGQGFGTTSMHCNTMHLFAPSNDNPPHQPSFWDPKNRWLMRQVFIWMCGLIHCITMHHVVHKPLKLRLKTFLQHN